MGMPTETTESQPSDARASAAARSIGELLVAAAVVVAIAGGLSLVASWREQVHAAQPIVADNDGSITLRPYRATIDGDLRLYPTDFEDQTEDYAYTHGRKVLGERMERKIGDWSDAGATVQWQFVVKRSGEYKVRLRYACDEDATGSTVRVVVGDDMLSKGLTSTGGWDEWSSLPLGRVTLNANRAYTLRVQAESMKSNRFINLEHIKLSPASPGVTKDTKQD